MIPRPIRMAHPAPIERSPYAFTVRERVGAALVAVVVAPVAYLWLVLFLTVLDAPR